MRRIWGKSRLAVACGNVTGDKTRLQDETRTRFLLVIYIVVVSASFEPMSNNVR